MIGMLIFFAVLAFLAIWLFGDLLYQYLKRIDKEYEAIILTIALASSIIIFLILFFCL